MKKKQKYNLYKKNNLNILLKERYCSEDFIPLKEYKILLAGDSFMEEVVLAIHRNSKYRKKYMNFISVAKHSTGLANGNYFNWPKKLAEQMNIYKPDFVLFFIGANDIQGITYPNKRIPFYTEEWKKMYLKICEHVIDIIQNNGAFPIWIGLPPMGNKKTNIYTQAIAKMQQQACINKNIDYIDSSPILSDEYGNFVRYKKIGNKSIRIRKKDDCHITYEGTVMILDQVLPIMKKVMWDKEHKYDK